MDHRDVGHQPLLHQRSLMLESQEKKRYPMHVGPLAYTVKKVIFSVLSRDVIIQTLPGGE
jgi:hypothetical protein